MKQATIDQFSVSARQAVYNYVTEYVPRDEDVCTSKYMDTDAIYLSFMDVARTISPDLPTTFMYLDNVCHESVFHLKPNPVNCAILNDQYPRIKVMMFQIYAAAKAASPDLIQCMMNMSFADTIHCTMWLHKCAKDTIDEYEQGRKILTVPDVSKTLHDTLCMLQLYDTIVGTKRVYEPYEDAEHIYTQYDLDESSDESSGESSGESSEEPPLAVSTSSYARPAKRRALEDSISVESGTNYDCDRVVKIKKV
jgi:hypothetical protein